MFFPPCALRWFLCSGGGSSSSSAYRAGVRDSGSRSSPPCFQGEMSSEKPVSGPPGSASALTDTDSHPPPGSSSSSASKQQQQQIATSGSGAQGERMVSAAGSMVLPAGVINPAVPIRNIQMKFAVLVGLIQVGEVSNRDIVETVLNLVSVSHFHTEVEATEKQNPCALSRAMFYLRCFTPSVVWLSEDDVICLFADRCKILVLFSAVETQQSHGASLLETQQINRFYCKPCGGAEWST